VAYPRQYIAKFLQQPHTETGEQPQRWEFQETAEIVPGPDGQYWYNVFWVDEFVDEVACSLFTGLPFPGVPYDLDQDAKCYWVTIGLEPETKWIRARAVDDIPYAQSEWSEPLLVVPEPSVSLMLFAGILLLATLNRRKRKIRKRRS
tara:strand:+ start:137 stop:577 length:441 start_codon:yes stop_codon:yes gene_type:complete